MGDNRRMNRILVSALLALTWAALSPTAAAKCFKANVCDGKGKNCREEQVCPSYQGGAELKTKPLAPPPEADEAPKSLLGPTPLAPKAPCETRTDKGKPIPGCK